MTPTGPRKMGQSIDVRMPAGFARRWIIRQMYREKKNGKRSRGGNTKLSQ